MGGGRPDRDDIRGIDALRAQCADDRAQPGRTHLRTVPDVDQVQRH
jgi:hypothetical protein